MKSPDTATVKVVRSRRVLLPGGVRAADVVIDDGLIAEVTAYRGARSSGRKVSVDDLGELLLMPSVIDPHVHVNEPGRTHWEGFETATRAAAAGGVTTLIDMPLNSSPVTTSPPALEVKRRAAEGRCWVDVGFYGGVVPASALNESALQEEFLPLLESGVFGIKAFLCDSGLDDFPPVGKAELEIVMPHLAAAGLPLLVHAELFVADPASQAVGPVQARYRDYAATRPPRAELDAIRLLIDLAQRHQCQVHVVHLAAADAVPLLEEAKASNVPIGVETCPHYLLFSSEEIDDGDTRFKCAPPIRELANRDALRRALASRTIDWIGSDHSPCPPERKSLKSGDFAGAWGGIASLQLVLPATWTVARALGLSVADVSRWLSGEPARRLGLQARKGALEVGLDADLVAWDPERPFQVRGARLFHRHPLTPYEGVELFGEVERTLLRGIEVFRRGQHLGSPAGRLLEHLEGA